jgi:signal transduction histidine kinase
VKIYDNGIGISTEIKEKLFNIETRGSTRGTNGEYGTGLGLSICKELLTLNDGSIELLSEEGKGTEVIITLPALEEL